MKKIITPIIYALFLFPIMTGALSIIDSAGFILTIIYIILLFTLANFFLQLIEKARENLIMVNLRQSMVYYAGIITTFDWFIIPADHEAKGDAFIMIIFTISALAIIINAIFLYIQSKSKKPVMN